MEVNEMIFKMVAIIISFLAFVVAAWLYFWVKAQPSSNKRIAEVGVLIQQGANTFLKREYKLLARFAGIVTILILIFLPQPIWQGDYSENILMAIA